MWQLHLTHWEMYTLFFSPKTYLKFPNSWMSTLLHSISSGQETPNMSMSFWQSLLACVHRLRHGRDNPSVLHTHGAYRAHRNGLRSGEALQVHPGVEGWWEESGELVRAKRPEEFMTDLVKKHTAFGSGSSLGRKMLLRWTCLARV